MGVGIVADAGTARVRAKEGAGKVRVKNGGFG